MEIGKPGRRRRRAAALGAAAGAAALLAACAQGEAPRSEPSAPGASCGRAQSALPPRGDAGEATVVAPEVVASSETTPVRHGGDAADDPAIWVNPADPARSVVIGSDKRGAIAVYELDGAELQSRPDGDINNVDLRCEFRLAGRASTIVAAGNRSDNTIALYRLDTGSRRLVDVAARDIHTGITTYGSCLYRSRRSGRLYYFATSQDGPVEQWELFATREGRMDARRVRRLAFASKTEGCVADDRSGVAYVSEETRGIWRFSAEPGDPARPAVIAQARPRGRLVPDVEGLAVVRTGRGRGFLFASSQGDDSFAVFDLAAPHRHLGSFRIVPGGGVDGAENTDGIAVSAANLGPLFPHGVLVVHDGENDGNQNYKLVRLDSIVSG